MCQSLPPVAREGAAGAAAAFDPPLSCGSSALAVGAAACGAAGCWEEDGCGCPCAVFACPGAGDCCGAAGWACGAPVPGPPASGADCGAEVAGAPWGLSQPAKSARDRMARKCFM